MKSPITHSKEKLPKEKLRQTVLARRDRLDPVDRIEKSLAACEFGSQSLPIKPGVIVSGFWPIRSEIDPRPFMSFLQQSGARLCLPVVLDSKTIEFRQLTPNSTLTDTGFGTRGPGPDAEILTPQIILVPLAAFDPEGGRLGYGAGFYDRAIDKLKNRGETPRLVGYAFSCQQTRKVPMEAHDQPLHMIITDAGTISVSENFRPPAG